MWEKSSAMGVLANSTTQDGVMALEVDVGGQQLQNSFCLPGFKETSSHELNAPCYPQYPLLKLTPISHISPNCPQKRALGGVPG